MRTQTAGKVAAISTRIKFLDYTGFGTGPSLYVSQVPFTTALSHAICSSSLANFFRKGLIARLAGGKDSSPAKNLYLLCNQYSVTEELFNSGRLVVLLTFLTDDKLYKLYEWTANSQLIKYHWPFTFLREALLNFAQYSYLRILTAF